MNLTDELISSVLPVLNGVREDDIRQILGEIDLTSRDRPPRRTQLTLRRLRFSGERSGDFAFHPGVNVLRAGNLKGKTTILQLIQLCLTGSTKLTPNMDNWIKIVDLEFDRAFRLPCG